jgi:hypothetical protein
VSYIGIYVHKAMLMIKRGNIMSMAVSLMLSLSLVVELSIVIEGREV